MDKSTLESALADAQAHAAERQNMLDEILAEQKSLSDQVVIWNARKVEIAETLKNHEIALKQVLAKGTKLPKLDTADLRSQAISIDSLINDFPAERSRIDTKLNGRYAGLHAAHFAVKEAQINLAVHVYREAMKDVWPLADEVRKLQHHSISLDGLADPSHRVYGRLPDVAQAN